MKSRKVKDIKKGQMCVINERHINENGVVNPRHLYIRGEYIRSKNMYRMINYKDTYYNEVLCGEDIVFI